MRLNGDEAGIQPALTRSFSLAKNFFFAACCKASVLSAWRILLKPPFHTGKARHHLARTCVPFNWM
jgi:hypothetical protein